jgi:hypothetical protein
MAEISGITRQLIPRYRRHFCPIERPSSFWSHRLRKFFPVADTIGRERTDPFHSPEPGSLRSVFPRTDRAQRPAHTARAGRFISGPMYYRPRRPRGRLAVERFAMMRCSRQGERAGTAVERGNDDRGTGHRDLVTKPSFPSVRKCLNGRNCHSDGLEFQKRGHEAIRR